MQSLYGKPRGANVRGEQVPISLSHLIWIHIVVFNYLTRCTSIMVEQQTRNQSKTSVAAAFSDFVHYSWIWTRIEKSLEKMNIVHCTQLNEGINLFCAFISECHPLKNWFAPIWSLKRMLIMISKNNKYMFGLDYIYMLSAGQILPTCNATHVTARHRNAMWPKPSHTSNMILPGTDRSAVELWWCVVNIFVNTSTQWEYS